MNDQPLTKARVRECYPDGWSPYRVEVLLDGEWWPVAGESRASLLAQGVVVLERAPAGLFAVAEDPDGSTYRIWGAVKSNALAALARRLEEMDPSLTPDVGEILLPPDLATAG